MSNAQWDIVAILVLVGILDASDAQVWHYVRAGQNVDVGIQDGFRFAGPRIAGFLFGSFLLIWMASVLPRIATGIGVTLLLLVALNHADTIGTFIQFQPRQPAQGSKR